MRKSVYEIIKAMKSGNGRDRALATISKRNWQLIRRPDQTPPADDFWDVWIFSGGRGAGKTRTGAEEVKAFADANPNSRILLVARSGPDARKIMIEGESGIFSLYEPGDPARPEYSPATKRLKWPNGTYATVLSADDADAIRGVQAHLTWCDELAHWSMPEKGSGKLSAWENARLATRLGLKPRIIVTTSPKKSRALKQLHKDLKGDPLRVRLTEVSTANNHGALSPAYWEAIMGVYRGTRIGEQEVQGRWPWKL